MPITRRFEKLAYYPDVHWREHAHSPTLSEADGSRIPGSPAHGSRQKIEDQIMAKIEELLSSERNVTVLYNALFSQDGLFRELAPTPDLRREQRESALYKKAKATVDEMMSAAERELRINLRNSK